MKILTLFQTQLHDDAIIFNYFPVEYICVILDITRDNLIVTCFKTP